MVNQSMVERHDIKPQYYNKNKNSPARVIRDLHRLRDLVNQYKHPGLNTIQSNEKQELIEEYGLEHHEAFNLQFLKD